jgi:ACS family hexuronate transporter-like MFS transporter
MTTYPHVSAPPDAARTDIDRQQVAGWRAWIPSATMMLCGVLAYVDRQTLAVLSPTILHETGMSTEAYGKALSAFSLAYMIGGPLWGSFLDFIGLRLGIILAVAIWSIASISHAWVGGLLGFAIARFVLGFGEGAAFPGGLRAAKESLPPQQQGRGMALSYSGAAFGSLITPFIVVPIALRFGWRAAFLVTGAMGASWLILWLFVARPPLLRPAPRTTSKFQWPDFLARRTWVVISSFGLGAVAMGVVASWSPLYLNRAMGLNQAQLGEVIWIPAVAWQIGYFFWGWVADRWGSNREDAKPIFIALAICALPFAAITLLHSWQAVLAVFSWAIFIADGFVVMSLRVGAQIFPSSQTGMAAGIGIGSWSAVLAVLQPIWGRWFDHQMYGRTFLMVSLLPVLGTLLWIWLSADPALWRPKNEAADT